MTTATSGSFAAIDDPVARVALAMERDGRAGLLDRAARVVKMRVDYRAVWHRELRAGRDGQHGDQPSTWKLNGLWRAACRQARIEELQLLFTVAVNAGANTELLAGLLDDLEREWQAAHAAFLEDENRVAA
jgi:hypothetical protein